MTFWKADYKRYNIIPNNFLCVSISEKTPAFFNKKNAVIPYNGLFSKPIELFGGDFEKSYYNKVNNMMRKMGHNGFNSYISSMINMYENYIFHDDNYNPIKYNAIVFMFDENEDNRHLDLLCKLFENYGIIIKEFKSDNLSLF